MTGGRKTTEDDGRREGEQPAPPPNIKLIRIDLLWIRYLIR